MFLALLSWRSVREAIVPEVVVGKWLIISADEKN
jgi:hypothetical protein